MNATAQTTRSVAFLDVDTDRTLPSSSASLLDRYPHLKYAGTAPNEDERRSINCTKQTIQEKHTVLGKLVEDLKQRLREAEDELELVQQELDAHTNMLSPLRRIPIELLRVIFAAAIPSTPLRLYDMTHAPPWTLLPVCKHWRNVALMFGTLWSQIVIGDVEFEEISGFGPELPANIVVPIADHTNGEAGATYIYPSTHLHTRACELLELQLHRSLDTDLHIHIQTTGIHDYAQPFLRILLPYMHRCAHLSVPRHILAHTPLQMDLKRLTRVDICMDRLMPLEQDTITAEEAEFLDAISLVRPSQVPVHVAAWDHPETRRSWMGSPLTTRPELLSTLSLMLVHDQNHPLTEQLLSQVSTFTNLANLAVVEASHWHLPAGNNADTPGTRVIMPKLRKLHVMSHEPSELVFLSQLQLPALTHLSVDWESVRDPPPRGIVDLLTNLEFSKLRCLSIGAQAFLVAQQLRGILSEPQRWTSLETLILREPYAGNPEWMPPEDASTLITASNAILNLLTRSQDPTTDAFPVLLQLELNLLEASISKVLDMLESRRVSDKANVGARRIAGCRLTRCYSEHFVHSDKYTPNDGASSTARVAAGIFSHSEGNISLLPWPQVPRAFTMRERDRDSERNRRHLWWAQGLEREPEQQVRLDRLVNGGLELWLREPFRVNSFDEHYDEY